MIPKLKQDFSFKLKLPQVKVHFFTIQKKKKGSCFLYVCLTVAHTYVQASPAVSSLMLKQDQDGIGSSSRSSLRALALVGAGVSGLLGLTSIASAADEAEHGLACPNYPWPHNGILSSYDHSS